ncbi:unnamed protein product [Candida verbasci]|uniref:Triacylglycerol lipase n=1 Tax=Candida verbasci TaxID=1227364 RepID=A0A9W4XI40_9ASCO|nr:unnamed protein product [Candida verbasci]
MKFICLFFCFVTILAGPIVPPTPPDLDPFYSAPKGYENQPNGAILKSRPVPNPLTDIVNQVKIKAATQIMFRSEDTFGNPTAVITTVLEPFNADPSKVVSYLTFEDSGSIRCSPSYAIQVNSPGSTIMTQLEMFFIISLLNQGYYVSTPDYEGPKSAFCAGVNNGNAVLDSIRATLKSGNITGVDNDAKVAVWGYSGGSLASLWAASIQPIFAPELKSNLIGFLGGGFVTNITEVAVAVDGGLFSGIAANALGGLLNEYSQYTTLANSLVNPALNSTWNQRDKHCLFDALTSFIGVHWIEGTPRVFPEGLSLLQEEPFKSIIDGNGLVNRPDLVPEVPIFIYHGTLDHIVPIPSAIKTFNQWCEAGIASAEFAEDLTNGHITEAITGAPAALTWLIDRFNGVLPVKGCQHTTRLSNFLYPNILPSILDYFKTAFDAVLGLNLGGDVKKDQVSLSAIQNIQNLKFNKI